MLFRMKKNHCQYNTSHHKVIMIIMTNALQEPCWSFLFDICSLNSTEYCKAKAILNYSGKVNT